MKIGVLAYFFLHVRNVDCQLLKMKRPVFDILSICIGHSFWQLFQHVDDLSVAVVILRVRNFLIRVPKYFGAQFLPEQRFGVIRRGAGVQNKLADVIHP